MFYTILLWLGLGVYPGQISLYAGQTATFTATTHLPGATIRWYDAGSGRLLYTGPIFNVSPERGAAYYVTDGYSWDTATVNVARPENGSQKKEAVAFKNFLPYAVKLEVSFDHLTGGLRMGGKGPWEGRRLSIFDGRGRLMQREVLEEGAFTFKGRYSKGSYIVVVDSPGGVVRMARMWYSG